MNNEGFLIIFLKPKMGIFFAVFLNFVWIWFVDKHKLKLKIAFAVYTFSSGI